jgi:CRP-like cAMP-binding protein
VSRGNTVRADKAQHGLGNSLLAALPHAEYQRLFASVESVTLKFGEVLQQPGEPIRHVCFPVDCVISLLTPMKGHPDLEIALVGREGMVGIPLALGIGFSSRRALVQGPGTAMRMESGPFRRAFRQSMPLQQALYRYKHALVGQIGQLAACTQFHPVQARLARYLLMTADHTNWTEIRLTQEFLASMLGVQRPAVTHAVSVLEKGGLIKCGRGKLTILDRKRLGAASCECYQIIKRMYASMYAHD